jgi:hypothetical protein
MGKLKSMDELFAGRHFDRDEIVLCIRWYLRYKLSLRDLVEMMAEQGLSLGTHDNPTLGTASCAGVRQALGAFWLAHGTVMACRRDVPENPRQVGVALSGSGSDRPDSRLHAPCERRRGHSKAFFRKAIKHQGSHRKRSRSMATQPRTAVRERSRNDVEHRIRNCCRERPSKAGGRRHYHYYSRYLAGIFWPRVHGCGH